MILKYFCIISLLESLILSAQLPCPPPEYILPCRCNSLNGMVNCKRQEDPATVFKRKYKIYDSPKIISDLKLKNLTDIKIPAGTDLIHVINSPVERVSNSIFQDVVWSLKTIKFENTELTEIPSMSLSFIPHLEELSIIKTKTLTTVRKSNIKLLPSNIYYLFLMDNNIIDLDEHCFESLRNLVGISLAGNLISSIPFEVFPLNLNFIDLSENMFNDFPLPALLNCTSQNMLLYFNSNRIRTLKEENLKPLMLLNPNSIQVADNPIICDCEVKWLASFYENTTEIFRHPSGTCYGNNPRSFEPLWNLYEKQFPECPSHQI